MLIKSKQNGLKLKHTRARARAWEREREREREREFIINSVYKFSKISLLKLIY